MNPILYDVSLLSATATAALFSAIWQGSALAVCVAAILRFMPRLSPAARSVIWLNLFVLLALLQLVPAIAAPAHSAGIGHITAIALDTRWSLAIAAIWFALSLWRGVQLVVSARQLHRLAGRATIIDIDPNTQALLDRAAAPRRAVVCVSDDVARPSVLGFFHPRILLPPSVADNLSALELQQVVLHEMEHLRRADDWTNLFQKVALVLFPLNPALHWVERRLCTERELACDDHVLRSTPGRKSYAVCLTHLAEHSMLRHTYNLALGAWGRRPELVRRVQRILEQPIHSMGRKPAIFATGTLIAGSLGCALFLARAPQFVSFTAPIGTMQASESLAANELGPMSRQTSNRLGAKPQLIKAVMPQKAAQSAANPVKRQVRNAVLHTRRSAKPIENQRTIVMLTDFTDMESAPRLVLTFSQNQGPGPIVVPTTYAVVPTLNGWLILQI